MMSSLSRSLVAWNLKGDSFVWEGGVDSVYGGLFVFEVQKEE